MNRIRFAAVALATVAALGIGGSTVALADGPTARLTHRARVAHPTVVRPPVTVRPPAVVRYPRPGLHRRHVAIVRRGVYGSPVLVTACPTACDTVTGSAVVTRTVTISEVTPVVQVVRLTGYPAYGGGYLDESYACDGIPDGVSVVALPVVIGSTYRDFRIVRHHRWTGGPHVVTLRGLRGYARL